MTRNALHCVGAVVYVRQYGETTMSEEKAKAVATATAAGAPLGTREYAPVQWVCEFLGGCSRSTVDRLRHNKAAEFPRPLKFGKTPLFNIEEVRQWAASHRA